MPTAVIAVERFDGRPVGARLADDVWETSHTSAVAVATDVLGTVTAYADEGTSGEVRLISLSNGNFFDLPIDDSRAESRVVGPITVAPGVVEIQVRKLSGPGTVWVQTATLVEADGINGSDGLLPGFTAQPTNITAVDGTTVTFQTPAVNANTDTLTLERFAGGWTLIAGPFAPGGDLTVAAQPSEAGRWRWVARTTGGLEATSDEFTVTITPAGVTPDPTVVTSSPSDIQAAAGSSVTFNGSASGTTLVWVAQGQIGGTGPFVDIAGESGTGEVMSYTIGLVTAAFSGNRYRFRVDGADGNTVFTESALITVTTAPLSGLSVTDRAHQWF